MCTAVADMAHYYSFRLGTGGCSDSNAMDVQAGVETGISLLCSVLSGANLIHDVGFYPRAFALRGFSPPQR